MNLLERVVQLSAQKSDVTKLVICTHAKFSSVELCRTLRAQNIAITFCAVDYSREKKYVDMLISLGVTVVNQPEDLVPYITEADCAIEDGARISRCIARRRTPVKKTFFSVEQTSGGIRYFTEHPPLYPVVNVAMSPLKLDIENRRATPEGVMQYFSEATGKTLAGKRICIFGFGSIGEGLAQLARMLGAHVVVYDVLATKRIFAKHRGFETVEAHQVDHILPFQDVIFMATNTYQGDALSHERLLLMKNGAIICNAGSGRGEFGMELQTPGSFTFHDTETTVSEQGDHLYISFSKAGLEKHITVLGKAFPINLHVGHGTSHDAVEVVMAMLAAAALEGPRSHQPGLQPLSPVLQERIAQAMLDRENRTTFEPRFVKTKSLDVVNKAYGGVFSFHDELSVNANVAVIRAWFKTGSRTRGHYHRRSQEAYYVERGTADLILWRYGDKEQATQTFRMTPGDYLLIPEGYFHDVRVASDEDFECLVITTPPFEVWDQFFSETTRVKEKPL